jgi:hypothetical protein
MPRRAGGGGSHRGDGQRRWLDSDAVIGSARDIKKEQLALLLFDFHHDLMLNMFSGKR